MPKDGCLATGNALFFAVATIWKSGHEQKTNYTI